MRILIHSLNYFPELTGIGKYTGEMAEWLASRGHAVRVVTAPPYYPEWSVAEGYSGTKYLRESIAKVDVFRCPLWVPAKPSGLKRILHLASFAITSFPVMLMQSFWKPDVVFVVEPPLFCAPGALLAARLSGAKAWLHIQDFEVDAAFDLGILPSGKIRKLVLSFEAFLLRRFDSVSTISKKMVEKLEAKKVEMGKTFLFPNWVDAKVIHPLDSPSRIRSELGISENEIVCLYSGNMGEKQGLEILLDAARMLAEESPRIRFVLCGNGASKERLQALGKDLSNILWLPLQPAARLNDLLNLADIHLLPQRADVADLVMPSKLTGMLASGRPIVATAQPATQVAKVVSECGIVSRPGDAAKFTEGILHLAKDKALRMEFGGRARSIAVETLDLEIVLGTFEQNLESAGS